MFYRRIKKLLGGPVRWLFGVRIENEEKLIQEGGVLVCGNHISALDPLAIAVMCPQEFHFMAKEELFRVPLLGWFIKKLNAFPVKRGSHDLNAIKKAMGILKSGGALMMFPEGTRNPNDDPNIKPKAGVAMLAAKTNSAIMPIAIIGKMRPFGKVTLRVCDPIYLPKDQYGRLEHTEYKEISAQIMKKIKEVRDQ